MSKLINSIKLAIYIPCCPRIDISALISAAIEGLPPPTDGRLDGLADAAAGGALMFGMFRCGIIGEGVGPDEACGLKILPAAAPT